MKTGPYIPKTHQVLMTEILFIAFLWLKENFCHSAENVLKKL